MVPGRRAGSPTRRRRAWARGLGAATSPWERAGTDPRSGSRACACARPPSARACICLSVCLSVCLSQVSPFCAVNAMRGGAAQHRPGSGGGAHEKLARETWERAGIVGRGPGSVGDDVVKYLPHGGATARIGRPAQTGSDVRNPVYAQVVKKRSARETPGPAASNTRPAASNTRPAASNTRPAASDGTGHERMCLQPATADPTK